MPLLVGSIYVGVYYLMYQLPPWQKSEGMAAEILTPAQPTAALPAPLLHGRMELGKITSRLLPGDHPFYIYLPPGYDTGRQRYPVLYLLHGAPGKYTDWYQAAGIDQTMDALIYTRRLRPMIVVLPDGNGGPYSDTEWANSGDGQLRAEDYIVQEVIPYIDAHYRTLAERTHRAIGGLSTGAFGAVNISFHHPNLFGYVIGLSGNYLAARTWTGQTIWADAATKAFNSPISYAPQVSKIASLHIYLGVAPGDNDGDAYDQTQRLAEVLRRLHVPHKVAYIAGGHNWTYWKAHIVDGLEYLQAVMPPGSESPEVRL
ncbi:MAG TPA: alpha/beta hydrolase-fold protein [Herpetosiphonaceae bacterium]